MRWNSLEFDLVITGSIHLFRKENEPKFDIQVTITVLANNEIDTEDQNYEFLKISKLTLE